MNTQSIKGYDLRERIGAGGFGAVYRANQTTIGREVAIKIVLPGLANQPEFIRRFESEAQVVARLEHPHIVPLHDYWRDADGAYLVMRWLKGGSLRDALQHGAFDLRSAALLLDQIAAALSLAHRSGIIHRDLKPANILLDEDGNAYLTDFGIAKDLNLSTSHTQPDAIVGSLDYISPEQARSEAITPRTDIYSLGVTMYEVVSGKHPFEGFSSVERLYKHINDPLPEITTLDTTLSAEVNRVIQKATAKDPDHRYTEALAFAADFREAAGLNRTATNVVELLTQREQDILHLIIEGLSNKEIAQRLTVTVGTVKWYSNQIYAKLGVRSRVQAMVRARELNLLGKNSDSPVGSIVHTEDFYPENPYKGLRAFTAADHNDYFGREKLIEKLIRKLGETTELARFIAVVGPSGSGKSSLMKAGLVPAIWKGALPNSEKWFVAEMLPSAHPLDELEVALTKIAANHASSIREHLIRDERGLSRIANMILPNDGSDVLLLIDQFEEVFTLVEDEQERQHFLELIHNAVIAPRSRVRIVITLRADFYDRPLQYAQFGELVRSRMETILPLSAEELERAILKPAEQIGAKFEPGLSATIVSEVKYQAGALPLLQYALTELFERRSGRTLTQEAYQAIGGTVGALAKRADEIYLDLDETGQETARQMFLRLVTLGEGTEDTRRRVTRAELLAIALDTDVMDDIIDSYVEYRLLSLDNDPSTRTPTVEVAHEAILREWERLRRWLNESRDDVRLQRQLLALAAEWYSAKQDASFLLRGSRLELFEKWRSETKLALTERERQFIGASLAQREDEEANEERRQANELKLAHQAAEQAQRAAQAAQQAVASQKSAANRLRQLVAVLVLAVIGTLTLSGIALSERQAAQTERDNARRSASEAQYVALTAASQAALATGDTDSAIGLAWQAVTLHPEQADGQALLSEVAYAPATVRRIVAHEMPIACIALSPDGQHVIAASDDHTLSLWDIQTGQLIRRFGENGTGHTDLVITVAFSPDGRTILSGANNFAGSNDTTVILWDVETSEIIHRLEGHTAGVWSVAYTPNGQRALSVGTDAVPILWDLQTGEIIRRFVTAGEGNSQPIEALAVSPDGRTMLTGSWDTTLTLWDIETGAVIRGFGVNGEGHINTILKVVFSPDGRRALSGASDSTIILWDVETGQVLQRLNSDQGWAFGLAFSPDGRTALSTSLQGAVTLWDLETGDILQRLRGHLGPSISVVFTLDGHRALSSAADGTIRLWSLEQGQVVRHFAGHTAAVGLTKLSLDGRYVLSASDNQTTILWDVQTGAELWHLDALTWAADFSPDGQTLLLGTILIPSGAEGDLILVDTATGSVIRHFGPLPAGVQTLAFSPSGRTAVSGGMGRILILWDIATGQEIRRFTGYENGILDHLPEGTVRVGFNADGTQMFSGFGEGIVAVWETATGERIRELPGFVDSTTVTTFSFHNQLALVEEGDTAATLWDTASGSLVRRITIASLPIVFGELSPDEQFGVSSLADNSSILWDVNSGETLRRWGSINGGVTALSFSADGHNALVGFNDGRLQMWRMDYTLDELLTWTRANRYIPELSCAQRVLYHLEPLCAETTTP